MSQAAPAEADRRGRSRALLATVIGLLVVFALVAGRPSNEGQALDPAGDGPVGVRALVLLLGEVGGTVTVSSRTPPSDVQTAILLQDTLDEDRTAALDAWVRRGGTLVVTDPGSSFAGGRAATSSSNLTDVSGARTLHPDCPLAAVQGADSLRVAKATAFFETPAGQGARSSCYPTGDGRSYLLVRARGQGTVIALAGAGPFTNHDLGQADNAVLAVNLLVPSAGTRVEVVSDLAPDAVTPPDAQRSVWSALGRRWQVALLQLIAVALAVALWRARRLGRPVREEQPVELAGSDLVSAVADLYQAGGRRQQAAANLVADCRRSLAERLSLPPATEPEVLARVAAARTGLSVEQVMMAVVPPVPATDADLLVLAQAATRVQQEVARAR